MKFQSNSDNINREALPPVQPEDATANLTDSGHENINADEVRGVSPTIEPTDPPLIPLPDYPVSPTNAEPANDKRCDASDDKGHTNTLLPCDPVSSSSDSLFNGNCFPAARANEEDSPSEHCLSKGLESAKPRPKLQKLAKQRPPAMKPQIIVGKLAKVFLYSLSTCSQQRVKNPRKLAGFKAFSTVYMHRKRAKNTS